jgi:hypothetical protein
MTDDCETREPFEWCLKRPFAKAIQKFGKIIFEQFPDGTSVDETAFRHLCFMLLSMFLNSNKISRLFLVSETRI